MAILIYKKLVFSISALFISFIVFCNPRQQLEACQTPLPLLHIFNTPGAGQGIEIKLEKEIDLHMDAKGLVTSLNETPEKLLSSIFTPDNELKDLSLLNFSWFQKACKKNPIGLLAECTEDYCPLNRLKYPERRQKFEDDLTNKIIDYLKNKNEVIITDFGCGGLFQILVILSKLNNKLSNSNLNKTITVNLIDMRRDEVIELFKKQPNNIITAEIFDKENKERGYWLRWHAYLIAQFLIALQEHTQIQYHIRFYSKAENYLKDISVNKDLISNFILGIDILNDDDAQMAINDIPSLVEKGLKTDGYVCALNQPPSGKIVQMRAVPALVKPCVSNNKRHNNKKSKIKNMKKSYS